MRLRGIMNIHVTHQGILALLTADVSSVADAVANFGSSFAIRPVNYFNQLASRTVFDELWANITECAAPLQGIVVGAAQALG